jgi:Flp pilus assembly protein TadG
MSQQSKLASLRDISRHQRGAIAVLVMVAMVPLLGFAALAVDVGNLVVARNELQNAADAGALAGARCLYNQDAPLPACLQTNSSTRGHVNVNANQVAFQAATANDSQKVPVDVNLTSGNGPDVERGHWNSTTRQFTANAVTAPADLANSTTAQLNANPNFINAIRVTARREATPVQAFFSRVLGFDSFEPRASAVAVVGFAGTLLPGEADQPIVICQDSLLGDDKCTVGRMIPSTSDTARWTGFEQLDEDASCGGASSADTIKGLVCKTGNKIPLKLGNQVITTEGGVNSALQDLWGCWNDITGRDEVWPLTLPVVECDDGPTCANLVGAVNVDVLWVQRQEPGGKYACGEFPEKSAPCKMQYIDPDTEEIRVWNAPIETTGLPILDDEGNPVLNDKGKPTYYPVDGNARWDSFATFFNLRTGSGALATVANGGWVNQALYFRPDCTPHEPQGDSGGKNFGILAKIPRLVQ